jgi:hypothetical protein
MTYSNDGRPRYRWAILALLALAGVIGTSIWAGFHFTLWGIASADWLRIPFVLVAASLMIFRTRKPSLVRIYVKRTRWQ